MLEDKHESDWLLGWLQFWVTGLRYLWAILRGATYLLLSLIVMGLSGVCILDPEMSTDVQSPRMNGKFQKCLIARNLVISQVFARSESGTQLCALDTNESFCFLFEFLIFVLEGCMNKVINLTSHSPWVIFFILHMHTHSTSLLPHSSSFTGKRYFFSPKLIQELWWGFG